MPAAIQTLLQTLRETPAYVVDAKYEVLAWNHLATHFIGDLSAVAEGERNIIRWLFTRPNDDHIGQTRTRYASPAHPSPTCAPRTPATPATPASSSW